MKFGGEIRRVLYDQIGGVVTRGRFNFDGRYTRQPLLPAAQRGGAAFADFLLGHFNNAESQVGAPIADFRSNYYAVYIQDNWKVTPNLTLDYGLRWEYDQPFTDIDDKIVNIDYTWDNSCQPVFVRAGTGDPYEGNPPFQLASNIPYVRDGRFGRGAYKPDYNDFAPRLGLAWSVNPKTVVRAGGSRFHVAVRRPVAVERLRHVGHGDVLAQGGQDVVAPSGVDARGQRVVHPPSVPDEAECAGDGGEDVGGAEDDESGAGGLAVEQLAGDDGADRGDPELDAGGDREHRRAQRRRAVLAPRREQGDEQGRIEDAEDEGAADDTSQDPSPITTSPRPVATSETSTITAGRGGPTPRHHQRADEAADRRGRQHEPGVGSGAVECRDGGDDGEENPPSVANASVVDTVAARSGGVVAMTRAAGMTRRRSGAVAGSAVIADSPSDVTAPPRRRRRAWRVPRRVRCMATTVTSAGPTSPAML